MILNDGLELRGNMYALRGPLGNLGLEGEYLGDNYIRKSRDLADNEEDRELIRDVAAAVRNAYYTFETELAAGEWVDFVKACLRKGSIAKCTNLCFE